MPVKVSLTFIDGPNEGTSHDFSEGSVTLGRSKSDIILKDKKVSGKHCTLSIQGNDVWIEDLNSTNGTFIAGRRLTEKEMIRNLDEVVIGHTKFSVAIIDQISSFRNTSSHSVESSDAVSDDSEELLLEDPVTDSGKVSTNSGPTVVPSKNDDLPLPGAVYRETGIRRIEDLIQDEMGAFSKWDQPAVSETNQRSMIPKIKVELIARKGPDGISNFICTNGVSTIGRKDVDIRINDLDCSRKHAAVEIIGGNKVYVRDLASTNGTYVNGKKIAYQEVKTGDLIQIGQTIFEILIED
jgi:pSer/pThr/pTyr-binding forkhead associated (FHA) protein